MVHALIVAAVVLSCTATPAAAAADLSVGAHRGTAYRPENTLAGITNADWHGADRVEVDVRATSDGRLRLLHDATLDATTTCSGSIADRTAASLRQCRAEERWPWYRRRSASFDGKFRVPSLAAAVTRANSVGIPLTLDVKAGARSWRLRRQIRAATVDVDVQVRSVADVAWLASRTSADVGYCCQWPGVAGLEAVSDAGGAYISIPGAAVTRARVDQAHEYGLRVHVWTYRAQNRWLPAAYRSDGSLRARGDVAGWVRDTAVAAGADAVHADEPNLVD